MTECETSAKWHPGAIPGGQPRPGGVGAAGLPLRSCGYWGKSNGLWAGQRPSGRRYCLPLSWGFPRLGSCCRARIGRGIGNASASAQVTGSGPCGVKIVKVFELWLLPVPPAGFEPALTAPEANPVRPNYLRKRTWRASLGSVWVWGR